MIKLSDRLQVMADEIESGETMADIGTDHGFLPIYLKEIKKSPKVIMTDISEDSLRKAMDNSKKISKEKDFVFRLGSGLEVLKDYEVDAVVIAGMGGILMTDLLGKNMNKTYSFKKIILQPRSHIGRLRYWLLRNGFAVKKEQLVREGKENICEILTVIPEERCFDRRTDMDDIEYEFPLSLLKYREPLLEEYIVNHLKKEKRNLLRKQEGKKKDKKSIRSQKHRVEYLEYFLRKLYE